MSSNGVSVPISSRSLQLLTLPCILNFSHLSMFSDSYQSFWFPYPRIVCLVFCSLFYCTAVFFLSFLTLTWGYVFFKWVLREREEGKRRETGQDQLVASHMHPNWGSNLQPFGVWDSAPTIGATQPGLPFSYW